MRNPVVSMCCKESEVCDFAVAEVTAGMSEEMDDWLGECITHLRIWI